MGAPILTPQGYTLQEEAFAQSVASGVSQYKAACDNYNYSPSTSRATIDVNASRLASKLAPRIQQIIAERQAALAEKQAWDLSRMVAQAEKHIDIALSDHPKRGPNVSAANGALEIIGRATGLLTNKVEVLPPSVPLTNLGGLSVAELRQMIDQRERMLVLLEAGRVPVVDGEVALESPESLDASRIGS